MTAVKPLRADAQRRRNAIVDAARTVFETDGAFAPLDAIAVAAGVGNATLYRNFPTREALLAVVVDEQVHGAITRSEEFAATASPRDALLNWMSELAWQLRGWHNLPDCIAMAAADASSPMQDVITPLLDRTGQLLDQARAAGEASAQLDAGQLFELLTALSWAIDKFGDTADAARARVELGTVGVFAAAAR